MLTLAYLAGTSSIGLGVLAWLNRNGGRFWR